jgi:polysaccharide biosynthesis transport protein
MWPVETAGGTPMNLAPEEWNVTECIRILSRRKALILWIACMGGVVAALLANARSRVYESKASIEIQSFNDNFLNLRNIYPTAASSIEGGLYLQTEAELLRQDSLIEEVAKTLHLPDRPEFQPRSDLLSKLRQNIRIVPVRNSRIIQIVCDASDASLAADLANGIAQTFIEQRIEARQRDARQTYESVRLQLEKLGQELEQQEALMSAQSGPLQVTRPLTGEGDANQAYETLLQNANEARMASLVRQSDIQLIAPAEPAERPYKPNLPFSFAIGTLGGLVLAIGFVMLHEQNISVLQAPGQAGTYLARPELGAIPNSGWKRTKPRLFGSIDSKLSAERAVLEDGSSSLAEAFRGTVASILFSKSYHPHIVVVTSSRPKEGKTTVVANLGAALAEIGSRVLLIDGNMRQPRLHKIFNQANTWGLSDLLREENIIDELPLEVLVRKTTVLNLCLLPSGALTDNIFGLLYSDRMLRLFRRFRDEFDYLLVDAPPCLEFVDARNIGRYAEGLVLVVRANYTEWRIAREALQRLEGGGARVIGVILNRWDPSRCDMRGYAALSTTAGCRRSDSETGP